MIPNKTPLHEAVEAASELFEKELARETLHPQLGKLLITAWESAYQSGQITNNLIKDHGEKR